MFSRFVALSIVLSICVLWIAAVWIQIWYWSFRIPVFGTHAEKEPPVSVVVCVRNALQDLQNLMSRLRAQSYDNFEVVVVNDGPDPEIASYLHSLSWDRLQVVAFDAQQKTSPGKKQPLTAGIHAAQHEWILLTDADCLPGPHWITSMVHCGEKADLVLGFAPFLREKTFLNMLQRFDALIIATQYIGAALRRIPMMGVGRNMMYRKALFTKVNGFASHMELISGDDDLFVQSAGDTARIAVCTDKHSFVYSMAPARWRHWLRQKRRHLSASHAYTFRSKMLTSGFAISWLVVWLGYPVVLAYEIPWYLPLLFILLLWILFARQAIRLAQQELIPFFPVLSYGYCLVLVIFGILLTLKSPRTWSIF